MSITVYWACVEDEWIKATEPEPVSKRFYNLGIKNKDINALDGINHCPVFNESLKNSYAIKSIYDYSFKIKENSCFSSDYDQKFYDDHVVIRSIDKKFFSFGTRYVFFTEEDSLKMDVYQYPVFEENEITKRCMLVPGSFDIGKYFRNLEFSFILKKEFDEFVVKNEDVLYYLKFDSKEKIKFKQFRFTKDLLEMIQGVRLANAFNKNKKNVSIDLWYSKFKGKRYILNKIKENLLD
jgi:hypothetical protein